MRQLTRELLDLLPAGDPRAMRSRRDLVRVNWAMRQQQIMARALRTFAAPRRLVDLGSGDGRFLLGVAKRLARDWPSVEVVIADRQDIISPETRAGFAALGWSCESAVGDVFETLPGLGADIITANLFLHHFEDTALTGLLALAANHAMGFIACEPRRSGFALLGARMVFALGGNDVTRHDAVASVQAGFTGRELSALWPDGWTLREQSAFPFTHVFTARHV